MLYYVGDFHGDPFQYDFSDLKEGDILFQLGDFGILWDEEFTNEEMTNLKKLGNADFETIVILGNHENYDIIETLPITFHYGAECWYYKNSDMEKPIYFPKAGEIMGIDGNRILCIRGAESTDKHLRVEGISWWKQEKLSVDEIDNIFEKLQSVNFQVDYVLSHTGPKSIVKEMMGPFLGYLKSCQVSQVLEGVYFNLDKERLKGWYFGHFHENIRFIDNNSHFVCHYLGEGYKKPMKFENFPKNP